VKYLPKKEMKEKIEIEKYFDDKTMSIHLKEGCYVYGKKGKPGDWNLVKISKTKLSTKKVQESSGY